MVCTTLLWQHEEGRNWRARSQLRIRQRCPGGFGSYEIWKTGFVNVGKMRGVVWAICCQSANGLLSNRWISLHGRKLSGFVPVLVMDVWEHAFLRTISQPNAGNIHGFFSNIGGQQLTDDCR
jgi:Fe-Mn family superoxide dismutase